MVIGMSDGQLTAGQTPDLHAIREQCRHLCENRAFKASGRLRRLLLHLLERTLEQNERSLGQRQLAVEVFGKDDSFDPERDAIVRIEMGKLRRALELYYAESGQGDPIRISIPKGTYVPQFYRGRKSATQSVGDSSPGSQPTGIAVMPFGVLDDVRNSAWLADGLTEELSRRLTRIPELAVASRLALQPFCSPLPDLDAISRQLDIRFFLDGTVQRTGDRLRVNARLYDGKLRREV
jgi:TolB-like protein